MSRHVGYILAIDSSSKSSIFWQYILPSGRNYLCSYFIDYFTNRFWFLACIPPPYQERIACSMPHRPQLAVDLMSSGQIERY